MSDMEHTQVKDLSGRFVHANGIELTSSIHGIIAFRDGGILFAWPWDSAEQVEKFIAAEKRETFVSKPS